MDQGSTLRVANPGQISSGQTSWVDSTAGGWVFVLTGFEVFPKNIYYIDTIPVKPVMSDLLFIIIPTVFVGLVGSAAAARRASRRSPVEAFSYE